MKSLLALAHGIDALNNKIGAIAKWAVFAACFISAANAAVRYGFDRSSNAFLEIQWYLFAVCVMFGAPKVLRLNEHVRVDVLYGKYPTRTKVLVDLLGICCFLLPATLLFTYLTWSLFIGQFHSGEMSNNAGGLVRWPVTLTLPAGMFLLTLQGISEAIKRVGWLKNVYQMDTHYDRPLQ